MVSTTEELGEKLSSLTTSQNKIIALSDYFIKNSINCDSLVEAWYECFLSCKSHEKRLALFYVANEVINTTKNIFPKYCIEFELYLVECVKMCFDLRDVQTKKCPHLKLFKIWIEKKMINDKILTKIREMCKEFIDSIKTPDAILVEQPTETLADSKEIEAIFTKLINFPSNDTKRRRLIAELGESFQNPADLLKAYLEGIRTPSAKLEEITKFDEELEIIKQKLHGLEEILSSYCSDLEKEVNTRKEMDQ
ncbi:hypothetical protein HZS_1618, partial [Henneguya salminicola]